MAFTEYLREIAPGGTDKFVCGGKHRYASVKYLPVEVDRFRKPLCRGVDRGQIVQGGQGNRVILPRFVRQAGMLGLQEGECRVCLTQIEQDLGARRHNGAHNTAHLLESPEALD